MTRALPSTWLALAFALALPEVALAQGGASAPPLSLASDPEPPYWAIAATTDAVGPFFGDFTLEVDVAIGRAHSLFVRPRYFDAYGSGGIGAEIGYRLHPLAEGLARLFLDIAIGAGALDFETPQATLWAGADVGWRFVWGGLVLGVSGGVCVGMTVDGQDEIAIAPRIRAELGYAWM